MKRIPVPLSPSALQALAAVAIQENSSMAAVGATFLTAGIARAEQPDVAITSSLDTRTLQSLILQEAKLTSDLRHIRSRLNAPLPENPKDRDLIPIVIRWRKRSANCELRLRAVVERAQELLSKQALAKAKSDGFTK